MNYVEWGFKVLACEGDKFITVFCGHCGAGHAVTIGCGDRTCLPCRQREYERLKKKYRPLMQSLDSERLVFITVTRRVKPGVSSGSLRTRLKHTKECFSRLMRQKVFKAIAGGFYSIEVKYSKKYHGWNVHLHAVCEITKKAVRRVWFDNRGRGKNKGRAKADVISKDGNLTIQLLKKSWQELTGDSFFVDIAPVLDRKGGVNGVMGYILKYLSKPAEVGAHAAAYNDGLKRFRMVHAFGTWYPTAKNYRFAGIEKPEKIPLICTECGRDYWISEFELNKEIRQYRKERPGARVKGCLFIDECVEVFSIAG